MLRLPVVLLRHETRQGSHFDWLLGDPRCPQGALWAVRVRVPSGCWGGVWGLQRIAPHRRRYLTYAGPLTDGRGQVYRVDRGWFVPLLWTDQKKVIDLAMCDARGLVAIHRLTSDRYRAAMMDVHCG